MIEQTTTDPPEAGPEFVLAPRDIRRRRSPLLPALLRMHTLRGSLRVASLLAIDYAGVTGALFTALLVKTALAGRPDVREAWLQTQDWVAFAYLVTVLLFAHADLYAGRAKRPGLARIVTALSQTAVVALVFALASGLHFSSYYVFYGSLIFAVTYIGALRYVHLRVTGWVLARAGYQRQALLVGSGEHIDAVAHALSDRAHTRVRIVGYVSLTPRPDNGLRSLGGLPDLPAILGGRGRAGGDHRRP